MTTQGDGQRAAQETWRGTPATDGAAPVVTVVVPCYNASATIETTLGCALAQTLSDIEVVVVDDGSRDDSLHIVRRIAAADARVRLVEQANAGPSTARNRGATLGCGRLVAFLDADDTWTPDHLALNVAALDRDATIGISFSPCEIIDLDGTPTGQRPHVWTRDITLPDMLAGNPTATCSALVIRREVFRDAGFMNTGMVHAEDQEWLFRVVASGWRIVSLRARTVGYRTSPGGLSSSTQKMLAGWNAFLEHARANAPAVVAEHLPYATWQIRFYQARQAVRHGQPARIAIGHLMSGIAASPASVLRFPLKTLALAGACLSPALARRAISLAHGLRHG